jgi:hypothetical protein
VSLQPHITDADLQAVVNETHEVDDIDADDLRDLLERLEAADRRALRIRPGPWARGPRRHRQPRASPRVTKA